jgi:hypothetical protein
MGDVADLIKDIQQNAGGNGPGAVAVALDAFEGAISTVANLAGAFTGLPLVISVVNQIFGSKDVDEAQQAVAELLHKFQDLFDFIKADVALKNEKDIDQQLSDARSQLKPIQQFSPGDPNFEGARGDMQTFTEIPLQNLEQEAFWKRPFLQEAVYHDDWAGDLPPPKDGLEVFDYMQALPAFVECICIRVSVLSVLAADKFSSVFKSEANELANSLETFYNRCVDGIALERVPSSDEVIYFRGDSNFNASTWDSKGRSFGAVQTYSAASSIGKYPPDRFPNVSIANAAVVQNDPPAFQAAYARFVAKHAIASTACWKRLYSNTGLSRAWRVLVKLRSLARTPLKSEFDTGAGWSILEVNRLVKRNLGLPDREPFKLSDLLGLLGASKPLSVRAVLEVDTG